MRRRGKSSRRAHDFVPVVALHAVVVFGDQRAGQRVTRAAFLADEALRGRIAPTSSAGLHRRAFGIGNSRRRAAGVLDLDAEARSHPAASASTDATGPDREIRAPGAPDRRVPRTGPPRCAARSRTPARSSWRSNRVAGPRCSPNPCACRNRPSRRTSGRACARPSRLRRGAR